MENQAHGVEIGAMINFPAFHLFRRHIARRAQDCAGVGHAGHAGLKGFCKTKVGYIDVVAGADQDVLGIQVTVNDAFGVGGSQRLAELSCDRNRTLDGGSPAALEDLMKVLPFNEGHGDEFQAVGFAEVVDAQDVLLRNLAGKQELLFETLLGGWVRREFLSKNLQSNYAPQPPRSVSNKRDRKSTPLNSNHVR